MYVDRALEYIKHKLIKVKWTCLYFFPQPIELLEEPDINRRDKVDSMINLTKTNKQTKGNYFVLF